MMQSPTRAFAGIFGAVYLLVGLVGFAATGFSGFAAASGDTLILFELNPLHNIVHILVGALLLAGAGQAALAKPIVLLVGIVYAVVGVLGFFAVGESWNILALNTADNFLHLATAAVALAVVAMEGQPARPTP